MYMGFVREYSASQLVFYDETHTDPNNLRRNYGYSYEGIPAFMRVSSYLGIDHSCSGLCALALDGMMSH
jgi:hypothetical protein